MARVIFVGNLPNDVREGELADIFSHYGRVRYVDIKWPPKPPPYAFIEFEDPRDAEDASRAEDGKTLGGLRMRVEIARGGRRGADDGPRRERGPRGPNRGQGYKLIVKNIPSSCSWQDLKDHFRKVAPPSHADVERPRDGDTYGIVEFPTLDEAKEAVRQLDDTEFRGRNEESSFIRVELDEQSGPPPAEDRDLDKGPGPGPGDREEFPGDDARERERERERD